MNQLTSARAGIITPQMQEAAEREHVAPEFIRDGVAAGTIVILRNQLRKNIVSTAIGTGLRTKVSASVGMYGAASSISEESEKIKTALKAGADSIMDLSVSGDIDAMRRESLSLTSTPVGTLPYYQAAAYAANKHGSSIKLETEELFEIIERQVEDGVDFLAVHCGTTMEIVKRAKHQGRIDPLVSYGASHQIGWMIHHRQENPLYEHYDRLLNIAAKYDVTLSIADGMRPGCLADSLDSAQVHELVIIGDLVQRARDAGVQVIVKGPGHVPLNQLRTMVGLQKQLCKGAPYFIFGPVVTDIAAGYDHISAAIGGALSAWAGAEFICYVTPAEHIGLPNAAQVHEGVIAARIAAHAGDLAKGMPGAADWDLELSKARKALDWEKQMELAIDPERARFMRSTRSDDSVVGCAMCGKFCAMDIVSKYLGTTKLSC